MEIWTTVFMLLLCSSLSLTKKLDENKENAKKVLKVDVETAKEKRQIGSREVFGVGEIPVAAPQTGPALGTSVSVEPNPVILRQEVPRYITRTITRDVPVAVRTPVAVPVPVLQRVPVHVTKHVPIYYKVHVPVPYPVTVERHVPVDRPVYVDRQVPVPAVRAVPLPQPVFLSRPLPQPLFVQRQEDFPQLTSNIPDFTDIPFGLTLR